MVRRLSPSGPAECTSPAWLRRYALLSGLCSIPFPPNLTGEVARDPFIKLVRSRRLTWLPDAHRWYSFRYNTTQHNPTLPGIPGTFVHIRPLGIVPAQGTDTLSDLRAFRHHRHHNNINHATQGMCRHLRSSSASMPPVQALPSSGPPAPAKPGSSLR